MRIRVPDELSAPALDMTPIIDIVFNLLIFFLVATTFHQTEREMNVILPAARNAAPLSVALREIVVNVSEGGAIVVGGRETEPEALRAQISDAVAANPNQKVAVRGDRRVAYGRIVTVLDICRAAGVQEPYLDTIVE